MGPRCAGDPEQYALPALPVVPPEHLRDCQQWGRAKELFTYHWPWQVEHRLRPWCDVCALHHPCRALTLAAAVLEVDLTLLPVRTQLEGAARRATYAASGHRAVGQP